MVLSLFCGADVLRTAGRGMAICRDGRTGGTGLSLDLAAGSETAQPLGNREGALEAVRRGLALEPGDHEFQTLGREIEAGAPLETMEYH